MLVCPRFTFDSISGIHVQSGSQLFSPRRNAGSVKAAVAMIRSGLPIGSDAVHYCSYSPRASSRTAKELGPGLYYIKYTAFICFTSEYSYMIVFISKYIEISDLLNSISTLNWATTAFWHIYPYSQFTIIQPYLIQRYIILTSIHFLIEYIKS
jgi:hypothetical protein